MFERFTDTARRVTVLAQQRARDRNDAHIATEHLLLGMLDCSDSRASALLAEREVTVDVVEADLARLAPSPDQEQEALGAIGIDLAEVRRRAEQSFGPGALENTHAAGGRRRQRRRWGHIPFHRGAKTAFERALREALRRGDRHIGTEHVLLGILHPRTGAAQTLLEARGVTLDGLRAALDDPSSGAARHG